MFEPPSLAPSDLAPDERTGEESIRTAGTYNVVLHDVPVALGVVISHLRRHYIAAIGYLSNRHNVSDVQVLRVAIGLDRNMRSLSILLIGHSDRANAA